MCLYWEEGGVVLRRGLRGTLKRVVLYFERVVWYFEEDDVLLRRRWCGTLKRVAWYFEVCGVVL